MNASKNLFVSGIIDHAKLEELNDEKRQLLIVKHVKSVLGESKDGKAPPIIAKNDENTYNVSVDFTDIDIFKEEHGHLVASMICTRTDGKLSTYLLSMEYQPINKSKQNPKIKTK